MDELCKELDKVGMQYEKRVHPVTVHESVKHLIGFEPAGEWQVLITTKGALYSVVRGVTSFGDYEIMRISGKGLFQDPERFDNPQELVDQIKPKV